MINQSTLDNENILDFDAKAVIEPKATVANTQPIGKRREIEVSSSNAFYGLGIAFGGVSKPLTNRIFDRKMLIITSLLGLTMLGLLYLLHTFDAQLVEFAKLTRGSDGTKGYFIIPIIVALTFSFVHGKFTSNFWDLLGVKANSKKSS